MYAAVTAWDSRGYFVWLTVLEDFIQFPAALIRLRIRDVVNIRV